MLDARPFRALRYAPELGARLDQLIAPPYDVISEEHRRVLASRDPHNIVHLDLPRAGAGENPYEASGRLLRSWVCEGVLVRDQRPAFYACEQRYRAPSGAERIRRGLFARLRLEPFGTGSVIPHERTLESPRLDRQHLLGATRTCLSPVFMLHPDAGGDVARALADLPPETLPETRDDEGTVIRLNRIVQPDRVAFFQTRLQKEWLLIADGHHRYESSLAYRDQRRAAGQPDADFALVFMCSLQDAGLSIFPIHRLVRPIVRVDPAELRRRLEGAFELTLVEDGRALMKRVESRSRQEVMFGFVFGGEKRFWVARWVEGAGLDRPGMAAIPDALRRLDVILLHRLVLEEGLGITLEDQARQTHLDYVKDADSLFAKVADGQGSVGILLNPTRIEQVIEVARRGLRLPQKSTFFYPKVPTGLVLDPLDD